ncbi:MAG: S-layer homology domain-containing protein [Clostridiales bacterium]|nr:S-layer homology domain-containing protein [Clostridiales bacterium]
MFKKGIVSIVIITLLLSSMIIFAEEDSWLETQETEDVFVDVNQGEWYYEAVMTMNKYGIISGYPEDNTFRPDNSVSREEFATMMVNALQLETVITKSSFTDVADGYWASKYIETAKSYLTGFVKNGEYTFKPKSVAVREDMAVALVRALDKPVTEADLVVLNEYEDADDINDNLKNYVASAIANHLMSGIEVDGKKYIKPLDTLTRAQAAALLLSVVKEEKIVFDDGTKVVLNDSDLQLDVVEVEGGLKLSWDYQSSKEASGFKVVASKLDSTPAYPDNGNAKYVQGNSTVVYNNDTYSNGDLSVFTAGESYYFSITALVGEEYVTSNVVKATMPAAISVEGKVPVVKVSQVGSGIVVEWNPIDTTGLQGYKVVASKSDKTPVYPENGYATWITNLNTHSYYIEPGTIYKGGDLDGKFKAGETYHISVTAVYNSGKIAGNTVTYIMPGEPAAEVTTQERTPVVEAVVIDGRLVVEWGEISTSGLQGYKIVASKSNPNPVYSQDGYAFWITDLSVHRKEIYPGTSYNGGDLGGSYKSGEKYYVSVTAVYSDGKIPGNAIYITMP